MALSKADALIAVREIFAGPRQQESERLERIYQALRPTRRPGEFVATTQIPESAPPLMKELARKSETNYLPLVVKTFGQVMKADGYYTTGSEELAAPWRSWQRNRMDSRQTGVHRGTLQYGTSYAMAKRGTVGRDQQDASVISLFSPRQMTALYAHDDDEWPMQAVYVDRKHVVLVDEEAEYRFGIEDRHSVTQPALSYAFNAGWLTYLSTEAHEIGVTPVVRYRDRNLLAGEEQLGIVEPLMTINERINETTFQMMATQYAQAFKQRYIIGWVPANEQEELKAGAALAWYFDEDPKEMKIGELGAGEISPYVESRNSAIRDLSAIGQVPAQSLGIDGISNISDATLAGLEAAKNREADEITTSLGESHEQLLRLCAYIEGDIEASEDYDSELRWRDYEARSYAQTIDGLTKLVTGLGLPAEIALEDVPGMTEQRLTRARAAMRRQQGRVTRERIMTGVSGGDAAGTP